MTPCYYTIKNIKGGPDIQIPAFTLLQTSDFKNILSKYTEGNLDAVLLTKDDQKKLNRFLQDYISTSDIEEVVGDASILNINTLVEDVNKKIIDTVTPDNLWGAVYKFIKTSEKSSTVRSNLLKMLSIKSNKISAKLFNTLTPGTTTNRLFSNTSINSELYDINNKISEASLYDAPITYFEKLKEFLALANEKFNWHSTENLIKINDDGLREGNWNFDEILAYSDTPNKEHLFMGFFKRLVSKISPEQFNDLFKDWNTNLPEKYKSYSITATDPKTFFLGNSDNDTLISPEFDNLLKLDGVPLTKVKDMLNDVFDKLFTYAGNELDKTEPLYTKNLVQELFNRIYPNLTETSSIKDIIEAENKTAEAIKTENKLLQREQIEKVYNLSYSTAHAELWREFRRATIINSNKATIPTPDNLYNYLMNNIVINKDLIKLPVNKTNLDASFFANFVVTAIFPRGEDSVIIYGARMDKFGTHQITNHTFSKQDVMEIRKFDDYSNTNYVEDAVIGKNASIISIPRGITYELAKNILSPGDLVGNRRVIGIYPGVIQLFDLTKNSDYYQNYVDAFNEDDEFKYIAVSKTLFNTLSGEEFYIPSGQGIDIKTQDSNSIQNAENGDYFKLKSWEGYKRILHSDNNTVWTYLKTTDANKNVYNVVKGYSRADIESVIIAPFENSQDLIELQNLISNEIIKTSNSEKLLSSFKDPIIAKVGDFIVLNDDLVGKIINKESEIGLFWNKKLGVWEKKNYAGLNATFLSKDARIPATSLFSVGANGLNVEILLRQDVPQNTYKEVRYVVSKDVDKNIVEEKMNQWLPGSYYTSIGSYKENNPNFINSSDEDYTGYVLKTFGKDPTKYGTFVRYTGVNSYERNTVNMSLVRIGGIENLSSDFIKEHMLLKGVYFSIYVKNKIDPHIYTIEKIDGDKVYARRYFRNKLGEILLDEKVFSADQLCNLTKQNGSSEVGSLAKYYLQKNNKNFALITEAINESYPKEYKDVYAKDLIKLKKNLTTLFNNVGVALEETEDPKEFKYNQKAKYVTTEDGKAKIIIKKNLGTRDDLVHESMHLMLASLRLNIPDIYMSLLNSLDEVRTLKSSLLDKEELFLKLIGPKVNELETSFFNSNIDLKALLQGLNIAGVLINPDKLQEAENRSVVDILNMSLIDFLKLESPDNSHALYNSNLAQINPAVLRWLEEQNINLKCN